MSARDDYPDLAVGWLADGNTEIIGRALDEIDRLRTEVQEAREVVSLAVELHDDRCTPPDGRRMAAWCTWCDVLEPFREPK